MMSIQGLIMVVMLGVVYGDPTTRAYLDQVDINTMDNPYINPWTVTIHSGGEIVTVKTPVKKELPADFDGKIKIEVSLGGVEVGDMTMTLCEGFSDPFIVKDMTDHGIPKGQYPEHCPIGEGDWELRGWELPASKVPPGIPDCTFNGILTLYQEGKSPILVAKAKGRLEHKIPGLEVNIPGFGR